MATFNIQTVPGVTAAVANDTLTAPYNDLDAVKNWLQKIKEIAAIIIEPVAGNMGCIPPRPDFWKDYGKYATKKISFSFLMK